MLVKLLKYDMLFNYKIFLGMCLTLLGASVLVALNESSKFIGFSIFILFFFFLVSAIVSIILVIQSYHKSLYSANGYLTLTLPVKKGYLILSKLLNSMFWFNFVSIVAGLAGIICSKGAMWSTVRWLLSHWGFYASWAVYNLLAVDMILTLYLCITIGNCAVRSRRLGIIASFASVFIIGLIQTWITNFMMRNAALPFVFTSESILYNPEASIWRNPDAMSYIAIDLSPVLCCVVFCVIIYFINLKLLARQVNLQ